MKHKNLLLKKNNTLLYSNLFNDRFDSRNSLSFFDFLHLQFFNFLTSIFLFASLKNLSNNYSIYIYIYTYIHIYIYTYIHIYIYSCNKFTTYKYFKSKYNKWEARLLGHKGCGCLQFLPF
jgi:hypothetical protein